MEEASLRGKGRPVVSSRRTLLLGLASGIATSVLIARLWNMQILNSQDFVGQAEANRTRELPVRPTRGIIKDKEGNNLVINVPVFNVTVIPEQIPDGKTEELSHLLARLLGIASNEISTKISLGRSKPRDPISIARHVNRDIMLTLEEMSYRLPGVVTSLVARRSYQNSDIFGHIVGYTGPIPSEQASNYSTKDVGLDEDVGLFGLENSQQDLLRGKDGRRLIEVEAFGRERRQLAIEDPTSGSDITLTVSSSFQRGVHNIMARYLGQKGAGVAIALDPNTGNVLSLVSYPTFDNQLFADGISAEDYDQLSSDVRRPLVNHAVSGLYPPGSTYKVVAASAALTSESVGPNTAFDCKGKLVLPSGWEFPDWLRQGHGPVDLHRAIAESCNVYFYTVSGGNPYSRFNGIGDTLLANTGRAFGFGAVTGIDLPGELAGTVPDRKWKRETIAQPWVTGDTYQAAIGQGFVQSTPIQLLNMYAAIGNGGTLYKPRLIDRVESENGQVSHPPIKALNRLPLSGQYLNLIQNALYSAVNDYAGTGRNARSELVAIAGKTGTAEYSGSISPDGSLPSHAWFAGYAPHKSPTIAFAVLVIDGGEGSQSAALLARDIVELHETGEIPPMRYAAFTKTTFTAGR